MRFLARGIEHVFDVAVQRLHDTDPRKHGGAAVRRDQDSRLWIRAQQVSAIAPDFAISRLLIIDAEVGASLMIKRLY
jgi:hypothetical protein